MNNNLINKFGYGEMYEWENPPSYIPHGFNSILLGRFVTFSKNNNGKIILANNNDYILGVTSMNYSYLSNNPNEWQNKYKYNEFGNIFVEHKDKYIGKKEYDSLNEFYFMGIQKYSEYSPIINPDYDDSIVYKKRNERKEWICVNMLGKCIVEDNGECVPGNFCACGNNGIAIPGDKYYVINRVSKNTIMIVFR